MQVGCRAGQLLWPYTGEALILAAVTAHALFAAKLTDSHDLLTYS